MSFGVRLDTSISESEETRFKKKNTVLIRKLCKELPFTYQELESLLLIYYKFQKKSPHPRRGMTKMQLREFLHAGLDMTDYNMMENIVGVIDKPRNLTAIFPIESWARAMALFLKGSLKQKIDYCYKVYDRYGDGIITRNSINYCLRNCIVALPGEESDDETREFLDLITKKLDVDTDGKVSFEDYRLTVINNPLLLEVLGPSLPSRSAVASFLATFNQSINNLF